MPEIGHHEPGSFCWFELGTTDQSAAKNFYAQLFGWTSQDNPMGPGEIYTMFNVEGRNVAGGFQLQPKHLAQGIPPHWALYVSVVNADESVERASQLGAEILAAPFDVAEHGRMAVLSDPTGAAFNIWQPKQHSGVAITGVDGTVCWADLSTPDATAAKNFYTQLFNWKIWASERDSSGYLHISNNEIPMGGIPPAQYRDPQAPPHWELYFQVSNCAASEAKAQELGASVLMPTMTMEHVGTMAVIKDPQGAIFALFQPVGKPE